MFSMFEEEGLGVTVWAAGALGGCVMFRVLRYAQIGQATYFGTSVLNDGQLVLNQIIQTMC